MPARKRPPPPDPFPHLPKPARPAGGRGQNRIPPRYPLPTLLDMVETIEEVSETVLQEKYEQGQFGDRTWDQVTDEEKEYFLLQQLQHNVWIAEQALTLHVRNVYNRNVLTADEIGHSLGLT